MASREKTLIEELSQIDGKAEIVNGEIVYMSPTGRKPMYAARAIVFSLYEVEKRTGTGIAVTDNSGFRVNLPNRQSFSPDAAYFVGELSELDMKFFDGAPIFAVEVRSEHDYGSKAIRAMAQKRADYFEAGTLVVWDVDVMKDMGVWVYRASDPQNPTFYGRGEIAEAEPAVPGWTMPVDDLFPPESPSQ
jgi:Uma2 family endonuclease